MSRVPSRRSSRWVEAVQEPWQDDVETPVITGTDLRRVAQRQQVSWKERTLRTRGLGEYRAARCSQTGTYGSAEATHGSRQKGRRALSPAARDVLFRMPTAHRLSPESTAQPQAAVFQVGRI